MSVLSKLAGQTAIYGLSSIVVMLAACSGAPEHDISGHWQSWMIHGMGKEELQFSPDGSFIASELDSLGNPTNEIARGNFRVDGDTLRISRGHFVGAYSMQWKSKSKLLLVGENSRIALERLDPK